MPILPATHPDCFFSEFWNFSPKDLKDLNLNYHGWNPWKKD